MKRLKRAFVASLAVLMSSACAAAPDPTVQTGSDIPAQWTRPTAGLDYVRREVMIPMRDGVKLHTIIVLPKAGRELPIVLSRTPYNAAKRTKRSDSASMTGLLPQGDTEFVRDGYIRVVQDIRGKYGSEGDYVMTRPPMGPLNPSKTDDTTDAWDTVEWLVKNVPESNGRVGMTGSSYDGWTVVMALLDPHPALKVAAPLSPMVDGWMGDDWFHHGAFRQSNLDYFTGQMTQAGEGASILRPAYDEYDNFLRAGSAGAVAEAGGLAAFPFWQRLSSHPAYDGFWQGQALDRAIVAAALRRSSQVPTLWVQGLWDQEDIYGAVRTWEALRAAGVGRDDHLVLGPWRHSQVLSDATTLGPLKWTGDTATRFRRDVLVPFFDAYLRDRPMPEPVPAALIYNTGEDRWDRFADWPGARTLKPLYLQAGAGLGFESPVAGEDSYVSDPSKPVPFVPRPVHFADGDQWRPWLVQDQRFVADRPDVLTYETPILTSAVRVEGAPVADLYAKTTGSDADWVVKVIDVYPEMPDEPKMGGFQLAIALDIFRGRYRDSFERPTAIPAGRVQHYRFRLPTVDHVFLPGHRIMVQVQSSLFPLYDRNPQTWVPNIFFAPPDAYRKATMSIVRGGIQSSAVLLPVVDASTAQRR